VTNKARRFNRPCLACWITCKSLGIDDQKRKNPSEFSSVRWLHAVLRQSVDCESRSIRQLCHVRSAYIEHAPGDVTGAANGGMLTRVGGSHQREFRNAVAVFGRWDRSFDRCYESNSGHALLGDLDWSRGTPGFDHLRTSSMGISRHFGCAV
jgi:hypothetical protein